MEMSDEERVKLGRRIRARRLTEYRTKSAAYQAAQVNSGTWDRIEEGFVVRADRLAAAVELLWPDTRGDWTRIDELYPPKRPGTERVFGRSEVVVEPATRYRGFSNDPITGLTMWIERLEKHIRGIDARLTKLEPAENDTVEEELPWAASRGRNRGAELQEAQDAEWDAGMVDEPAPEDPA